MTRKLACLVFALAGCATIDQPTQSNLARYCSPDNAFRLGSQSRAYVGVCPKESEAQFLQELASSEGEREPLRARLRELEWWAIHLLNSKGNYLE